MLVRFLGLLGSDMEIVVMLRRLMVAWEHRPKLVYIFRTATQGSSPAQPLVPVSCEDFWSRRRHHPVANSVPNTQPILAATPSSFTATSSQFHFERGLR